MGLVAAAMLGGCTTSPAPNRADDIVGTMQDAQESLNACIVDTYNDPQFEPLGTHMPMNMRGVSMEQLTDQHFATDAEIQMLLAYDESAQSCRRAYLDELRPVSPTLAALTQAAYSRNQDSLSGLMAKKLSWGQYIQAVVGTYRDLNLQLAAELKRLTNGSSPAQGSGG
jgi:hypothetical protein